MSRPAVGSSSSNLGGLGMGRLLHSQSSSRPLLPPRTCLCEEECFHLVCGLLNNDAGSSCLAVHWLLSRRWPSRWAIVFCEPSSHSLRWFYLYACLLVWFFCLPSVSKLLSFDKSWIDIWAPNNCTEKCRKYWARGYWISISKQIYFKNSLVKIAFYLMSHFYWEVMIMSRP